MSSSSLPKYSHLLILYFVSFLILCVFGIANLISIRHGYNSTAISWVFLFVGVGTAMGVWQVVEKALLRTNSLPKVQTITVPTFLFRESALPAQSPVAPSAMENVPTKPDLLLFSS